MHKKENTAPHKNGGLPERSGEGFLCQVCGQPVAIAGAGSRHRNHCPHCLSSLHLDKTPGDRQADCGGVMEPIGVWVRKGGEWAVLHRCCRCGKIVSNRIAADDNPFLLLSLAAKPLAQPPFPLERLAALLGSEDTLGKTV